jgi:hypothetical protein
MTMEEPVKRYTAIGRDRFIFAVLLFLLLLLSLSAVSIQAQEFPQNQRGSWDISPFFAAETGEETTNSFSQAQIWTAGIFFGRVLTGEAGQGWLRGNLEYGFDALPLFVQTRIQTVYGVGFDPVILRWNSSHHPSRLAPYIELSGGGVATTKNLPPGDTSTFNFMAKGGGGIYVHTRKRQAVDIACRWSHVSNANLGVENPEFNGVQVSVGYHWFK